MSIDYIAGPMGTKPKLNFPLFDEVAAAWRRKGNKAINPADHDREVGERNGVNAEALPGFAEGDVGRYHQALGTSMDELLGWDLAAIITQCDGIIMLPGWEKSTGAGHEKYVAEATGKRVQYAYQTPQGHWLFLGHDRYAEERAHSVMVASVESVAERYLVSVPLHHQPDIAAKVQEAQRTDHEKAWSMLPYNADPYLRGSSRHRDEGTVIVGLMGYAQVGKDTLAEGLVKDYGFTRLAFADTLRECLYALNPNISDDRYQTARLASLKDLVDEMGWDRAKQIPEVRALLQRLGTDVGRAILGEDIWVNTTLAQIEPGGKYVITDVRFPNELRAIADLDGTLVRIMRDGYGPVNGHASETALDGYTADHNFWNDGTPVGLVDRVAMRLDLRLVRA